MQRKSAAEGNGVRDFFSIEDRTACSKTATAAAPAARDGDWRSLAAECLPAPMPNQVKSAIETFDVKSNNHLPVFNPDLT